jgi:GrpB-like predicted nucleotidyltransferase (UPF0157 family)
MGDWMGDATLGLSYGQVRLVPSDPRWPAAFQRLAARFAGDRRAYTAAKAAFIARLRC